MATKIESMITAVEAAIVEVYARSNQDGPITCTVAASWNTTTGNVSAITLTMGSATKVRTFSASELIGRHLYRSGVARRITANAATVLAGTTALTTSAWTTAPAAGSGEIRDGFVLCPDDVRLADAKGDRLAQLAVGLPTRDPEWGIKGTARWRVPFEIGIAYRFGNDYQHDLRRIAEDIEAMTDKMLDATKEATGVVVYVNGSAVQQPVDGGVVVAIPFVGWFAETSIET